MFQSLANYKTRLLLFSSVILVFFFATSFQQKPVKHKPVVIELFTSEGCSSCPPADLLLHKTVTQAAENKQPIYALAFHVDYWNRLGWIDSFSNKSFSERQQNYVRARHLNGAYTPQMIVNGTDEFVGSDDDALRASIKSETAKYTEVSFKNLTTAYANNKLKVNYELDGDVSNYDIQIAIILKQAQTNVKNGENHGRTLNHTNVVRQFKTLKVAQDGHAEFDLTSKNNIGVIAFLQQHNTLVIMDAKAADIQ